MELLLLSRGAAAAGLSVVVHRSLAATDGTVGLAVRCPSCRRLSLNLVSHPHVDVPFHNDREIGVVEHLFAEDARRRSTSSKRNCGRLVDVRRLALE